MKNRKKVFVTLLLIIIATILIVGGGTYFYIKNQSIYKVKNYSKSLDWSPALQEMSWTKAKAFCENPINGYTRLPTVAELNDAITDQFLPDRISVGPKGFIQSEAYWAWSYLPSDNGDGCEFVGYNDYGYVVTSSEFCGDSVSNPVRCVRTLE
jgi:hypothetical protein